MVSNKTFIPLNDYLTVKNFEGDKVEGGIIVGTYNDGTTVFEGMVVHTGEESNKIVFPNEEVIFNPNGGYEFEFNGEKLIIIDKQSLFGKII